VELEDGEQLLTHPCWCARIGETPIEQNGLPEAVEIRGAIGALSKVFADLPARTGSELYIELFLKMSCDLPTLLAMSMNPVHQVPR